MATYVAWGIFAGVAALLGFVGYHFSVRTVRWLTAITALGLALAITAYGLARSGPASSNLESSFALGAGAVGDAFFHPLGLGNPVSGPGRAGWVVIVILLVLGYGGSRPGRCTGRRRSSTRPSSATASRASSQTARPSSPPMA